MKKEELTKTRQYAKISQRERAFVAVPVQWCARFNLSPTELLIFCYIQRHTEKYVQKAYTGSVKGLCVVTNTAIPTVRRALEKLERLGFIRKTCVPREMTNRPVADWVAYISLISSDIALNSNEIDQKLEANAQSFKLLHENVRLEEKKRRSEARKRAVNKKNNK